MYEAFRISRNRKEIEMSVDVQTALRTIPEIEFKLKLKRRKR